MSTTTPSRAGSLTTAVLCLRSASEPADWFLEQVHALEALEWTAEEGLDDEAWLTQAASTIATRFDGAPVHVIAAGAAVPRALLLAARRRDLVTSILAGDPQVDESDAGYWELLRQVHAPTLVVVAAPEPGTDTSQAQSVAGGIDNGVMVVIDGAVAPTHRSSPKSFTEWATAFMVIAEGLPNPSQERTDV